eukprot:Phypoly_transcript_04685.p1 GENE.Phypoly_transcript_04685~~Phypoly_transcript_04685.p1  ORF type:complete len:680 (+),score=71.09 Phypoly_transcript_04685:224-2041(+)
MATSYLLSDKTEYPFFLRTMPSDRVEMDTIIALFKKFSWKQGIIVYSDDDFGGGFQMLTTMAAQQNITFYAVSVPTIANETYQVNDTVNSVINIMKQRSCRIFVYYTQAACGMAVRTSMYNLGYTGKDYVNILTVPIAGPLISIQHSHIDDGAIGMTIDGPSNSVYKDLYAKWKTNPDITSQYPLFFIPNLITDWLGVDALLTLAYAADALLKAGTPFDEVKGETLLKACLSSNFTGTTGQVFFDKNGDRYGDLALYSIYSNESIPVGYYSSSTQQIVQSRDFLWAGYSTIVPGDGSDLLPIVLGSQAVKIIFAILVGICVLIAASIMIFLLVRPMAFQKSGRFYCSVIIFGAILAYAAAFTTLPEPTDALCLAFPWLLGLGFILLFGCLFLKTWALFQVFRAAEQMKKTTLNPLFIMKILGGFLAIEVIFMVIWTVKDPPKAKPITVSGDKYKQHTCVAGNIAFWAVFIGYKGFWMLFGAIISFLVRNVRDDYNESAGIGMAVYNCFGMTAIALVLGLVLKNTPNDVVIIENVAIIVTFTATLVLLFSRICIDIMRGKTRYATNQSAAPSQRSGTGSGSGSRDSSTSSITFTKSKQSNREVELV